jgi:hypothetical protein
MGDPQVLERIAAWEAAGLIESETAERLRAAEAAVESAEPNSRAVGAGVASWFRFNVAELFGYLGIGFLMAAYYWGVSKVVGETWEHGTGWAIGTGLAAIVYVVAGYVARDRDDAAGRAAGPLLLVGGFQVFVAVMFLFQDIPSASDIAPVVATLVWLAAALLARRALAALPTQSGLLAAIVSFAWAVAGWVGPIVFGRTIFEYGAVDAQANLLRPIVFIAWMLGTAGVVGFLGEREARQVAEDPGAGRRAALTRFWAAMTAVIGTAFGVVGQAPGFYGRDLEPFVGDAILVLVACALVALAMRLHATSYLLPAGLGVVVALTDLNGQYVADELGLGPALLLEGVALLAVGYGTELMRRRLARRRSIVASS